MGQPTQVTWSEDTPQTTHNSCGNNPESDRDITWHGKTATSYATTRQERPVFIPTSRDWFHLGSRDTLLVRQVEVIQRPTGTYIGPFNDKVTSMANITDQSEDHNWRRRKKNPQRKEEAVFDNNWPKPRTKDKHTIYKQTTLPRWVSRASDLNKGGWLPSCQQHEQLIKI